MMARAQACWLVLVALAACDEPQAPAPPAPPIRLEEVVDLDGFRRAYSPQLEPLGVEREGTAIVVRARVRSVGGGYTQVRLCAPAGEACTSLGPVGIEIVEGARALRDSDPVVQLVLRPGDALELVWDASDPREHYGWLRPETPESHGTSLRPAPCSRVPELPELTNVEVAEWSCFVRVGPLPAHAVRPVPPVVTLRATAVGDAAGLPPGAPAIRVVPRDQPVRARWLVRGATVEPPIVLRVGDTYRAPTWAGAWSDAPEADDPLRGLDEL
ncbi:MAG: hypothetical protein M5U28_55470 [Sandaracinaceae bacterium]|nr:hypothetical protein [Sandaracinaceae bacterium]